MLGGAIQAAASLAFPSVEQLRRGVILGTIIRAIYTLPKSIFRDEYTWRGQVLMLTDYNETRGCLAFDLEGVVGAFFDCESERSPFGEDIVLSYDAQEFFAAAPPKVLDIARREILPHLISWLGDPRVVDEAILHGTTDQLDNDRFVPVITAAFWSEGDALTAVEPWSGVYYHGAHILHRELLDWEVGLSGWAEDMELIPDQVALARRLFMRRLATNVLPMRLTAEEYAQLISHGATQLEPVKELLGAVAIELP